MSLAMISVLGLFRNKSEVRILSREVTRMRARMKDDVGREFYRSADCGEHGEILKLQRCKSPACRGVVVL